MNKSFSKFMILVTVLLMDILGGAEVDLFVPSFPELKSQFDLSPFWVEGLLSINFAGFCLSLFVVGGLADRYGRKPIILLGTVIFIIGSALCTWAMSYHFLLAGRFLQGIGIAAPASLCFLIIADSYPLKQQQYLMGMLNGLINVAVAAAPVAGSYLTMYFHWQGNFIALLLAGVVVLVMTLVFIPNDKTPVKVESIGFKSYLPIFQSMPLMLLTFNTVFMFAPYYIFLGMSPILYMEDLGVSLSHFGYYQGAWALVFALGSIFYGLVISRYDQTKMLYASLKICSFGLICIAWVAYLDSHNPLLIALSFLPFSIGSIIHSVILYPIALNFMPKLKGRVSAVIRGLYLIFAALGLELTGYCYQGSFQNIGIILSCFTLIGIITMFLVIRNPEIMKRF